MSRPLAAVTCGLALIGGIVLGRVAAPDAPGPLVPQRGTPVERPDDGPAVAVPGPVDLPRNPPGR